MKGSPWASLFVRDRGKNKLSSITQVIEILWWSWQLRRKEFEGDDEITKRRNWEENLGERAKPRNPAGGPWIKWK